METFPAVRLTARCRRDEAQWRDLRRGRVGIHQPADVEHERTGHLDLDGTNAVLTALPEIATSFFASPALAVAITRDAAFIAGQVHVLGNNRRSTRARREGRVALSVDEREPQRRAVSRVTFTARINNVVEASATTGATAISDNGAILYGTAILGDATVTPRTDFTRAVRFDINTQTSTLIPVLGVGHVGNNPVSGVRHPTGR